ncbi:MAG: bifunctional tetrahydrofolate synthase/dihydrofolate synthase [Burkholderiales bacterium]
MSGADRSARPSGLEGWLAYLESLHPRAIALGLDRVRAVLARLDLRIDAPVVTVTGTNGKGSTSAMLASMLRAAGYRTGLYQSPHLVRYNERVKIDGREAGDDELVDAFHAVEDARTAEGEVVPLTYFEFGTLAALLLCARARVEALVLEVGLGGRLDAVNAIDADVAVVTSIDLDHQDWLGADRESIGREKAGIFRAGRMAVCGDRDPPASLVAAAAALGAPLIVAGRDFRAVAEGRQWRYEGPGGARYGLPLPALPGSFQIGNAACAIAALDGLSDRLPVSSGALREGLVSVELPGRFQVLPGRPTRVLDVAHNPHAARTLAATLGEMGYHARTLAVFGMLADKDAAGVVEAMRGRVDAWFLATLPPPRGATAGALAAILQRAGVASDRIRLHDDAAAAWRAAVGEALEADRIVAFGSFLTVAAVLDAEGDTRERRD